MDACRVVRSGGLSVRLWPVEGGRRWRWHYYEDGRRKTGSAVDVERAKLKAREYLRRLAGAPSGMTAAEASEYAAWRQMRRTGAALEDAFAGYLSTLNSAGRSQIYCRKNETDLQLFAAAFPGGRIGEIDAAQVEQWIIARGVGPRRANNLLATLVGAFRHARQCAWLPDGATAPERVKRRALPRSPVQVFTPAELAEILAACDADWKPSVAIQAVAGVRTAEVSRLYWRDIKPEKGIIEIPAAAAKTGRRRLVPILEPLLSWLPESPDPDEMVCPYEGHSVFLERFRRKNRGIKWHRNGLRHSFGSYRCAILRDVPAVAFEMGNSVQMVQSHYHEAQEVETAQEWFSIVPHTKKGNQKGTKFSKNHTSGKNGKPRKQAAPMVTNGQQ